MDVVGAKRLVQVALGRLGFEVRRIGTPHGRYSAIQPYATFSPWNTDDEFGQAYEKIRDHTLVDVYRCFELWSLVPEVNSIAGVIVEVGVWRGGTGALLAKSAQRAGIREQVFLCDTFRGVVKAGALDPAYRGGEHADTSAAHVKKLMDRLELDNVQIVEGVFPEDCRTALGESRMRLAHIDVDVYQSAADSFDFIWPRLSVGGIVVFDDYGFE